MSNTAALWATPDISVLCMPTPDVRQHTRLDARQRDHAGFQASAADLSGMPPGTFALVRQPGAVLLAYVAQDGRVRSCKLRKTLLTRRWYVQGAEWQSPWALSVARYPTLLALVKGELLARLGMSPLRGDGVVGTSFRSRDPLASAATVPSWTGEMTANAKLGLCSCCTDTDARRRLSKARPGTFLVHRTDDGLALTHVSRTAGTTTSRLARDERTGRWTVQNAFWFPRGALPRSYASLELLIVNELIRTRGMTPHKPACACAAAGSRRAARCAA